MPGGIDDRNGTGDRRLDDALDAQPDVVVVATPEHLHRDAAVRALAVAHVLVEKPIASTVEDAEAIRAAADSAGRLVFVGHLLRFDPRPRRARVVDRPGPAG